MSANPMFLLHAKLDELEQLVLSRLAASAREDERWKNPSKASAEALAVSERLRQRAAAAPVLPPAESLVARLSRMFLGR